MIKDCKNLGVPPFSANAQKAPLQKGVGLSAPIVLASLLRCKPKRSPVSSIAEKSWSLFLAALIQFSCALFPLLSLTQNLSAQEAATATSESTQEIAEGQMTLEKAIALGLENNFQIKISEKNILVAQNNNTWARAGRAPSIDLAGNWNTNVTNDSNPASFLQGTFVTSGLGPSLQGNMLLYAGGRVRIAKEQLDLAVTSQELMRSIEVGDMIRNITAQYFAVLLQQQNEDVLQRALGLSKQRLAYEETKREFGASNSYNLIQFSNAQMLDSTNVVMQMNRVEVAKQTLYTTLNLLGFPEYDFTEQLNTTLEEIDEQKLRDLLEEKNFTLRSLMVAQDLNRLNTRLEEAARRPTVSVNANVGITENYFKFYEDNPNTGEPFEGIFSERIGGGINLSGSWNLYDGGVRRTNIENAKLQEDIGEMNMLEAKAELVNQLDILLRNYDNQRELLALTEEQLKLAEQNLAISEERFKGGQLTSLDYTTAQNQLLSAAFSRTSAIYNLILTKNDIDFLVGVYNE